MCQRRGEAPPRALGSVLQAPDRGTFHGWDARGVPGLGLRRSSAEADASRLGALSRHGRLSTLEVWALSSPTSLPMRVLVADDDEGVMLALELLFEHARITLVAARSPAEVMQRLEGACDVDVALLDLNYERDTTSGQEGFSLLGWLRARHPRLPVLVMTAWASIEGAVEAMRRGAVNYVSKPWDNARLVALLREHGDAERPPSGSGTPPRGRAMRELYATVKQVAFSDVSVLITGEHGVGKELLARAVHDESGRTGRFVTLNASALPEGTFESELFGHVRGAFTDAKSAREGAFARADGGTLFFDEIADMPLSQQAKLLRVLQERAYQAVGSSAPRPSTARIVSATNVAIEARVADGRFRADLLYRLNTIRLEVPALRERRDEIEALAEHFLEREAARHGLPVPRLEPEVRALLESHDWPGNVRELLHALQRGLLLSAQGGVLTCAHLGLDVVPSRPAAGAAVLSSAVSSSAVSSSAVSSTPPARPPQTLRAAEEAAILEALECHPNDRRAAARSLGLSRSAFYRRLAQYGLNPRK
jgi:DNA-binding NtrC family response regulator